MSRVVQAVRTALGRPKRVSDVQDYWRSPPDAGNRPEDYLAAGTEERSELLVGLLERHATHDQRIFEVGCNAGRNLDALYRAGFTGLGAVEINAGALELLRESFPDTSARADIRNEPVEDAVRALGDDAYDWVYSMAVFEHVHTDSDWIFGELARIASTGVITIEDEGASTWKHFPRDYGQVFTAVGLEQVHDAVVPPEVGLGGEFRARVFRHPGR